MLDGASHKNGRNGTSDAAGPGKSRPDSVVNKPSPGGPCKLTYEHKRFLVRLVEKGPIAAVHGVVRWHACDLIMRQQLECGVSVSVDTIHRALIGFSHVSARPKSLKGRTQTPWRNVEVSNILCFQIIEHLLCSESSSAGRFALQLFRRLLMIFDHLLRSLVSRSAPLSR
jgi:hypothetical protein